MVIRWAEPDRDAAACASIYAPYVRDTAVSMEEDPPDASELAGRIERVATRYPWLIAEGPDGDVAGYAYATAHHERAAYRWAADVAVYVAPAHQGRRVGSRLYGELLPLLVRQGIRVAVAGIALPNAASVALHEAPGPPQLTAPPLLEAGEVTCPRTATTIHRSGAAAGRRGELWPSEVAADSKNVHEWQIGPPPVVICARIRQKRPPPPARAATGGRPCEPTSGPAHATPR